MILCINYVEAQYRPSRPAMPARPASRYKKPPARVLNKVQPKGRTRQQQMQIKLRQMSNNPLAHGRIKPAQVRAYQDERCVDNPDERFPHETECDLFYYCGDDDNLYEWNCEGDTPIFDWYFQECMSVEEGQCWHDVDDGNWDAACPENPYEIAFFYGETCNDYYICLNGFPTLLSCAPGQHWNEFMEYCDTPANAQCDVR